MGGDRFPAHERMDTEIGPETAGKSGHANGDDRTQYDQEKGDRNMKKIAKTTDEKKRQQEFKRETECYESTIIDKVIH
jgi:hypothetical protein